MDGTPARSGLSYRLASRDDDATLRALLRDNAMPSWITLSLEREPSWFAVEHDREWAVIARDAATPVGMYACREQRVHYNGKPTDGCYLHSLRLSPSHRHRVRVLRDGFASIPALRPSSNSALWFTSISSENSAARRFLEANLPGMPRYEFLNGLVTMAIASARGRPHRLWTPVSDRLRELCNFYNARGSAHQLAPYLTPDLAARSGATFFAAEKRGRIVATMALWNRQVDRQIVVRGYRSPLGVLRPVYNLYARATRRLMLPPAGEALDVTYLAFLAIDEESGCEIEALTADALSLTRSKILMLALHADHPWLGRLQARFRPACYESRIYTVDIVQATSPDGRPAQPDVAFL